MKNIKSKLHELIDSSNDNIFLENIYNAMRQHARLQKRDIPDDLSEDQLS